MLEMSKLARGLLQLTDMTVKLLTIKGAKGLDFPCVFLVGPRLRDLGGPSKVTLPETRRELYVALTRASESLTVGLLDGIHHPLLNVLDDRLYQAEGSRAPAFVNLRETRAREWGLN